jgi:hypothetical protein
VVADETLSSVRSGHALFSTHVDFVPTWCCWARRWDAASIIMINKHLTHFEQARLTVSNAYTLYNTTQCLLQCACVLRII